MKIQPSCSVLLKIKQEEKEIHGHVTVARLHGTRIKRTWRFRRLGRVDTYILFFRTNARDVGKRPSFHRKRYTFLSGLKLLDGSFPNCARLSEKLSREDADLDRSVDDVARQDGFVTSFRWGVGDISQLNMVGVIDDVVKFEKFGFCGLVILLEKRCLASSQDTELWQTECAIVERRKSRLSVLQLNTNKLNFYFTFFPIVLNFCFRLYSNRIFFINTENFQIKYSIKRDELQIKVSNLSC